MMVGIESSPPGPQGQSVYGLVMKEAAQASNRKLLGLLGVAVLGIVLAMNIALWPLAALSGTMSAIALWGFTAHIARRHPLRLLTWFQFALVGLGTVLAILAALAIFYWTLGSSWQL